MTPILNVTCVEYEETLVPFMEDNSQHVRKVI